jgi:thiol-disulfide isomerase/thioredoxin
VQGVGLVVLLGTLLLATVAGLVLRGRSGRPRTGGGAEGGWQLAGREPRDGDQVLLLQLSSPICTPCRRTATLLGDLVHRRSGLVHREVDVAVQPDIARELGVMRTPTVVAFDRHGRELLRVAGVPRTAELEKQIAAALRPA